MILICSRGRAEYFGVHVFTLVMANLGYLQVCLKYVGVGQKY
jgi:hypothetical protein